MTGIDRRLHWLLDLVVEQPDNADADFWCALLQDVLDGKVASLDAALGLRSAPGWNARAPRALIDQRDEHIRAVAREFGLDAAEIERGLKRYAGSSWKRERDLADCPPRLEGTPEAHYWRALRARPNPIGEKQIRRIV